jgi:stage III sporulation protein AC
MVMNVDIIFKIAAIGIVVTILNQVLIKAGREEQAMLTTLVGVIVVLTMVVNLVTNLFDTVKTMFQLY